MSAGWLGPARRRRWPRSSNLLAERGKSAKRLDAGFNAACGAQVAPTLPTSIDISIVWPPVVAVRPPSTIPKGAAAVPPTNRP